MAKRSRHIRGIGLALILFTALAAGAEDNDGGAFVVPPGQDELLASIFGYGAKLVGGECSFTGGKADGPVILASFDCAGGEVIFQLEHPSAAPEEAFSTDRFALTIASGTAPETLVAELLLRLRAGEEGFVWQALDAEPAVE